MLLFLTCAAIALFSAMVVPRFTLAALRTFRSAPWRCLGISMAGVVGGSTLFNFGLDRLDVGIAGVLEKLQPIFVIFLGMIFLGERYPAAGVPWVLLALGSSYVVSQKTIAGIDLMQASVQGMMFALLAAFCYSVASILGRSVLRQGAPSAHIALLRFLLALPVFLLIIVATGEIKTLPNLPIDLYVFLAFAAIFLTGGGYIFYYRGLQRLPAAKASLIELSSSIFAVILGKLFLDEQLLTHQLVAGVVLLFAITIASGFQRRDGVTQPGPDSEA